MTPLKALTTYFNKTIALSEFGSNYFLTFFILLVILIIKKRKNNSNLLISFLFVITTFVSIVIFWGLTKSLGADFPISYLNPINVIFDSVVEFVNVKNGQSSLSGLAYILGFQFLGVLAGFLTFILFYYILRRQFNSYFEQNTNVTLYEICLKNYEEKVSTNSIKEVFFIFLYTITIPIFNRVSHIQSGLKTFDVLLINMAILFFIFFLSSNFKFYTFHIFIGLGFTIMSLILEQKQIRKIIINFSISLSTSIIIPIVIGLITFFIIKGGSHAFSY
ncbi:MAG4940 family membrane protein [Mycoplasma crocodyli]|uniref:MAG4940 family membrane protein n=1 Tax=Mycoplasma crocodyli TaxID=50052 RepID=UPI0002F053DF|nr:hypothetical protein [Mycoplasma crocodyli]